MNMTTQYIKTWDMAKKTVLRMKFIAISASIEKLERHQIIYQ